MANPNNAYQNLAYSLGQPLANIFPSPVIANRAPISTDLNLPIGQLWIYVANNAPYLLTSIVNNSATWQLLESSGGTGVFSTLTVNPGPTSLSTVGNGAVSVGNATNTGALTFTVGTGNMSVVGGGNTIGIGNDAAANTVILGSTNTTATTEVQGGTGGILVFGAAAAPVTIGAPAQTATITLGQSTAANTINIGNAVNTGAEVINIASGASGANSTVNVLTGVATAGTQVFNCLTGLLSQAGAVNIGTGTAAHVVTIGSVTGAASTTIQAGTGGMSFSAGGLIATNPVSVSSATTTVVNNVRVGVAVYTGQTTANGSSITLTLTNSLITATSAILLTANNVGSNDAEMTIYRVNPGAGSATIILHNNGAAALNGNINLAFWIMS